MLSFRRIAFPVPRHSRHISAFGYTQSKSLIFTSYGAPPEVLSLHTHSLSPASGQDLTIRFLASPINPADINQIEGVYPSKPEFSTSLGTSAPAAVPGNEGVVEVLSTGADVKGWKKGDRAVMKRTAFGTWRTHAQCKADALIKVPQDVSVEAAATVSVNPCTAYRMLRDFVPLEKGDWFIQNGANSGVGRAAIQLGKIWGLRSVNVVRDRPDIDELKSELQSLGADIVVSESELGRGLKGRLREMSGGKGVKLGLNCVGGKPTTDLMRQLAEGAHLVTYGGMSKQPVTTPTGLFIFSDLHAHGFWVSRWSDRNPGEKQKMLEELFEYIRKEQLETPPTERTVWKWDTSVEELKEAVRRSMEGYGGKKQIFVMEET